MVAACSGAKGISSTEMPGISPSPCSRFAGQKSSGFAGDLLVPKLSTQSCSPSPPGPQNQFPPLKLPGLSSQVPGEKRRNPVSQAVIFQPRMIFIISVPKAQRGTGHTGAEQPGGCWNQKKMRQNIVCKVNLNQSVPGGAGRRARPTATSSIFQGYR